MEIFIKNDGKIKLATGRKRNEIQWANHEVLWSAFLLRLSETSRTGETAEEYKRLSKQEQDSIKDVGGYVAGVLQGGKRKNNSVKTRSVLTLDLDFASADFWDSFTLLNDFAAAIYSTHKHSPDKPRLRLLIPLAREVTPEEYEAVAHRLAGDIGIEMFDDTTYEPARLMYWPSTSASAEYVFKYQDGVWLDPDEYLKRYCDWRDMTQWPVSAREKQSHVRLANKQGDPLQKPGLIGAFCRAYTITDAINKFLTDAYTPAEDGRYTYVNGSTTGGLIVYESDKFAYSHHGTDPAGGKLCNAFDLVRLHKFGEYDADCAYDTDTIKLPSYLKMLEFVGKEESTQKIMANDRIDSIKKDFDLPNDTGNNDWEKTLEKSDKGGIKQTIDNAKIILENDVLLKNKFWYNEFSGRYILRGSVPWRKADESGDKMFEDSDTAGLRHYLEKFYGQTTRSKIDDSVAMIFEKNSFHPVRDYLDSLLWDGTPRVETLLIDTLGAEDCEYVRAVTRKILAAAVARVYKPGIKFDTALILIGPQGIGKSMLISRLGRKWYSDSLTGVDKGKDSYEQLQGYWIIELGELNALRKKDSEDIKGFLSKCEDVFRVAYGKYTACFPRQCVFFGTTNSTTFLTDTTGNRRFWPVDLGKNSCLKRVWELTEYDIDQIWAEAKVIFNAGESLILSDSLTISAEHEQESHSEDNPKLGQIAEYLDMLLPDDWYERDLPSRRLYSLGTFNSDSGTMRRTEICIGEVWSECFGKSISDMKRADISELHALMQSLKDWELMRVCKRFTGGYGSQRLWYKRNNS